MALTEAQFKALNPMERGYVVYVAGKDDSQPNVPDESNPYAAGSPEAEQWDEGQQQGVMAAQDSEE